MIYNDALDILKQRFRDNRIIVQDHRRCLLDLEPMTSSTDGRELRQLYNLAQVHIRSLRALGTSSTTYCAMLREILLRVLPTDMVLRFHERLKAARSPAGALSKELGDSTGHTGQPNQELHCSWNCSNISLCVERPLLKTPHRKFIQPQKRDGKPTIRVISYNLCASRLSEPPTAVLFCHPGKHSADTCYSKKLRLSRKKQLLAKAGRCFSCLPKGHTAKQCRSHTK